MAVAHAGSSAFFVLTDEVITYMMYCLYFSATAKSESLTQIYYLINFNFTK